MSALTPERLAEIREWAAHDRVVGLEEVDDLLAEVDRLRAGIEALADRWQRIPGDGGYETACRDHGQYLRALLRDGSQHDHPTS